MMRKAKAHLRNLAASKKSSRKAAETSAKATDDQEYVPDDSEEEQAVAAEEDELPVEVVGGAAVRDANAFSHRRAYRRLRGQSTDAVSMRAWLSSIEPAVSEEAAAAAAAAAEAEAAAQEAEQAAADMAATEALAAQAAVRRAQYTQRKKEVHTPQTRIVPPRMSRTFVSSAKDSSCSKKRSRPESSHAKKERKLGGKLTPAMCDSMGAPWNCGLDGVYIFENCVVRRKYIYVNVKYGFFVERTILSSVVYSARCGTTV